MHHRLARVLVSCFALACLGGGAFAEDQPTVEPRARPMLYVAVGPDQTLFLLGTMHASDTRVTAVHPLVDTAIDRADEYYGELPFDQDVGTQMLTFVRLPRNRDLKQILGAALWNRTETLMALHDETLDDWDRVKPWIVDSHVGELFAPKATRDTKTLDETLYALAKQKGKPVEGLETVYEQVRIFDVLPYSEQVLLLEQTVARLERDRREGTNSVETMIRKYLSGDPEALLAEVETYFDFTVPRDRKMYDRLHAERNARMLERLEEKAKTVPGRVRAAVIGAAHLAGQNGMLAMLRGNGYAVWPVATDADIPRTRDASMSIAVARLKRKNEALSRAVRVLSTKIEDLEARAQPTNSRCCPKTRRRCRPRTCERRRR